MDRCPHCDRSLPLAADAFCGACGGRLDEPPGPNPPPVAGSPSDVPPAEVNPAGVLAVLAVLGGGGLALVTLVSRRGIAESVYTGVPAVALMLVGLSRLSAPRPKGD